MNYYLSTSEQDSDQVEVSELKIGDCCKLTGRQWRSTFKNMWAILSYDRRLVLLNNPSSTWAGENVNDFLVTKLKHGEQITITGGID